MINKKLITMKLGVLLVYIVRMFSVADFPPGNVSMTVYSNGVPLSKAQLQYYSNMDEITCLLARAADPVDFMCQVKPLKGCFTSNNIHILVVVPFLSVMIKWEIPQFLHIKVSHERFYTACKTVFCGSREALSSKKKKKTLMISSGLFWLILGDTFQWQNGKLLQ